MSASTAKLIRNDEEGAAPSPVPTLTPLGKAGPAFSKADYETLSEFRYTLRQFLHFSQQAAKKAGLSPQAYQALVAVQGFPGRDRITIGELAERLHVRHHSAVGLVNRLSRDGLVQRASCPEDRRKVLVTLTDAGLQALERLVAVHRRELRRLSPRLRAALDQLQA